MKESEKKTEGQKDDDLKKESVVHSEETDDEMPNEGSCSPEFSSGCIYPEDE